MTATIATAMPVGKDWSHEVKWDGYRALLVNDGKHVRLVSRNLKDLTADYPQVAKALAKVTTHPVMLDGEIVALDEPASRRSRLSSTAAPVARWWCFMPSTSCTVRSRLLRQATPGAASDTSGPDVRRTDPPIITTSWYTGADRTRGERCRSRRCRRQAHRLHVPSRNPQPELAEGEVCQAPGVRHRRL
jgi:hypothetical protein